MSLPYRTIAQSEAKDKELERKVIKNEIGFKGNIKKADVKTENGIYNPIEEGVYVNANNLDYLPSTTDKGYSVKFVKDDNGWEKELVDLNQEGIEKIFDKDNNDKAGSMKAVDVYMQDEIIIPYKRSEIINGNNGYFKSIEDIFDGKGVFSHNSSAGVFELLIYNSFKKIDYLGLETGNGIFFKIGFFKYTRSTRVFDFHLLKSVNNKVSYSIVSSLTLVVPSNFIYEMRESLSTGENFEADLDFTEIANLDYDLVYLVTGQPNEGNLILSQAVDLRKTEDISNKIKTFLPVDKTVDSMLSKLDFSFDFSSVLENCKNFLADFIAKNKDLIWLILGDSIFGQPNGAPILADAIARNLPPNANYENWFNFFYDELVENKPTYHRYDSQSNIFTESGSFATELDKFEVSNGISAFSAIKRQSVHRTTTDANASITQTWNLDNFEKMAFIFPKFVAGVQVVTIDVGGTGKVQVLDTDGITKVEAHGYTFTQYIDPLIATDGSGFTQVMDNFHLRLFKVDGATGSINISFSKGNNAETLAYYGSCFWNGNTILLQNLARPGQPTKIQLRNTKNEISERYADLIICQTMSINDYDQHHSDLGEWIDFLGQYFVDDQYGRSLKQLCTDVEPFDKTGLITVMPNWRSSYYNGNIAKLPYNYGTVVPEDAWREIKSFFIKNNLKGIDMSEIFKKAAIEKELTYQEAFTASDKESLDSFSFDNTHLNKLGYMVLANALLKIFKKQDYQF